MLIRIITAGVAACIVVGLASQSVRAGTVNAIVPAYFYPSYLGSDWDILDQDARRIKLTAIANVFNGPGTAVNSDYTAAIDKLHDAGGTVVGYVYTEYGSRSLDLVKHDIDNWLAFYNTSNDYIAGFFIDQMSTDPAQVNYYHQIYNYVKSKSSSYTVIGNPGTNPSVDYVDTTTADTLVTFESPLSNFASYSPAAWMKNYSPSLFANIVYDVPTAFDMLSTLEQAIKNNAGSVYITNLTGSNPYSALPSYWDEEVAAIQATTVPEPPAARMAMFGFLASASFLSLIRCASRLTPRSSEADTPAP